eukprot:scaffold493329_cov32-Prasinocladus_malaysianus.AAC.1
MFVLVHCRLQRRPLRLPARCSSSRTCPVRRPADKKRGLDQACEIQVSAAIGQQTAGPVTDTVHRPATPSDRTRT